MSKDTIYLARVRDIRIRAKKGSRQVQVADELLDVDELRTLIKVLRRAMIASTE